MVGKVPQSSLSAELAQISVGAGAIVSAPDSRFSSNSSESVMVVQGS